MNRTDTDRMLKRVSVILVRPQISENIGAAARVVSNMGLGGMIVVRPRRWNPGRMCALATRLGRRIILEKTEIFADLEKALAGFNLVIGTTARGGKFRRPQGYPGAILKEAVRHLESNRLAVVFGPEKDGLTNDELTLCHSHIVIPTTASATSLNLAQAVMVAAYELRLAVLELDRAALADRPVLADTTQREGMFDHIGRVLESIDPESHYNRRVWMGGLRRMFGRFDLMPHEVQLIRGICRKICWAVDRPAVGQNKGEEIPSTAEERGSRELNGVCK